MNRILLLAAIGTLGACADQPMMADALPNTQALDEAAPPRQTLVLTNLGVSERGQTFGWRVTGANPGQQVLVMAANGGIQPNGGTCASYLGGNCADILPGTLGYRLAAWGNADGTGTIERTQTLGTNIAPGDYQFQAFVLSNRNNGNESNPTETTVFAGCPNDGFEVNNSIAAATPMPAAGTGAVVCDTDLDVYALEVPSGATVEISISYDANLGDVDLELVDANGVLLDQSGSATNSDLVLWQNNGPTETVYARMFSLEEVDPGGSPYTIDYEFAVPTVCVDDGFEDDDTAGTARVVSEGLHDGHVCTGDADWFRINVQAGEQLSATVSNNPADGDVRVAIFGSNGTNQLSGLSAGERYTATSNGNLWVRTILQSDSANGGGAAYDLNLSLRSNLTCPVDSFENNDTQGTAATITAGLYDELGGCNGDDDWYKISVNPAVDDVVYVSVLFDGNDADLDVEILNPAGQQVAEAVSGDSNENLSTFVTTAGDYYIHVYVWSGSNDGAPTNGGAIYDLVVYTN